MSTPMKIIEISECTGCKWHRKIGIADYCLNDNHPKYSKNTLLAEINRAKNSIDPDCPLPDNIEQVTAGHTDLLIKAERILDYFNGLYGNISIPGALCQWCGARIYTPKSGIDHQPECIILQLRKAIQPEE